MGTWDRDELYWAEYSEIVVETPDAYLLDIENESIWAPKSEIDINKEDKIVGLPKWLAKKEGLLD